MTCTDYLTASARAARLRTGTGVRHGGPGLRTVCRFGAASCGEASRIRVAMSGNQYPGGRSAAPGDDR